MSEKTTKGKQNNDVISLPRDKFAYIDPKAEYIFKEGFLFIKIEFPQDLKEICTDENLSSSGKTYRIYSNSTNRKFIKNKKFGSAQIQINSYLSVKDSLKL